MTVHVSEMVAGDYDEVVALWQTTKGVGLNESRLGSLDILKCNIYLYVDNEVGERFWRNGGWAERADLKVLQKGTRNPNDSACNPT